MISPRVSRSSAPFGSAGSTSRRAASALLTIAPSGWLISCASVAVSSPTAVTRWTWASWFRCMLVSASARFRRARCTIRPAISSDSIRTTASVPMIGHRYRSQADGSRKRITLPGGSRLSLSPQRWSWRQSNM